MTISQKLNVYSEPHLNNFCGGAFQDWLEVNLLPECNGKCSWCIEHDGYHPTTKVSWEIIAEQAVQSKKTNIILLGGEPTLYADIDNIITYLNLHKCKVWITTNGGLLTPNYILSKLNGITGINISIHNHNLDENKKITGIRIRNLKEVIDSLHSIGINVRLNCNCISGYIDSFESIKSYIDFAKSVGADKIRFAELKFEEDNFVDLAKVFDYQFGLNDDPFTYGCIRDIIIDGMPVNIRQMCGLQTTKRPCPINPKQFPKTVLYYDGKFYDGWQVNNRRKTVTHDELSDLLKKVADGKTSPEEAKEIINLQIVKGIIEENPEPLHSNSGGGCNY